MKRILFIVMALTVCLCVVNLARCDIAIKTDPMFWILQNDGWIKRYTECMILASRGDSEIVFLGDSNVENWEFSGNAGWNIIDGVYKAGNFGISGINTSQLLWMINAGRFLAKIKPKYALVLIGTNDYHQAPPATVTNIRNILGAIKTQSPHTGIILVSILPRGDNLLLDYHNRQVNNIISHFQGPGIFYLDVYGHFLNGAGNINRSLYIPDLLHLNSAGYALLTQKLLPLIP
jgi:lysophospholipase L1-like esterase